jgi:hypothetical protein
MSEHPLEPHRHPEVYAADEPLPEPGKREPFFSDGLWPMILSFAMLFGIMWTGIPQAFGDFIKRTLTALLK